MKTSFTRFPEGSVRELGSVSLPLMISALASLFMLFTDRMFLARYSIDALNASVNAGTLAWAFICGIGMITAMSEVFVAQYNGAKQYARVGKPVWQMIWFSCFSWAFFLIFAAIAPLIFSGDGNETLEATYFRWLMLFGPAYALMTAFSGFFIGRGKTSILILLAVLANLLNMVLDWLFIFGAPPYIPEMGVKGAAIATSIGYLFQAGMLALLFFRKKHREYYGTGDFRLDFTQMKQCCRVGFPQGIFSGLEFFGWAVFYWMMTSLSKTHITVSSLCQSLLILLSFFYDGLSRGIAAVAGNFLGAKRHDMVYRVLRSSLVLVGCFCLLIAALMIFGPEQIIQLLFFEQSASGHTVSLEIMEPLRICLYYTLIYLFFDGMRWVLSGLLVTAGDTFFLLIAGSLSVWVGLLLPMYFLVVKSNLSVETAWLLHLFYGVFILAVYALRFKQGAWKQFDLVSQRESGTESVSEESPKN